jgi:hypothetical protein
VIKLGRFSKGKCGVEPHKLNANREKNVEPRNTKWGFNLIFLEYISINEYLR